MPIFSLQTFQSEEQSAHSDLCEILQSASVTVTCEEEPGSVDDAVLTTGTCSVPELGMVVCYIIIIYHHLLHRGPTLGVLVHGSSCCCSNPNEGTSLLCISVYAVSVDVLTHAVDLHKTASR